MPVKLNSSQRKYYIKNIEKFGKLKKTFKKIGGSFKKMGQGIKKGFQSVGKALKNVNWKKVGNVLYQGVNMVVPVKVFVKIAKGEKLNMWDIVDLVSLVPIPVGAVATMGAKIAAKQLAKVAGKAVAKAVAKQLMKQAAKSAIKKTFKQIAKEAVKKIAKKMIKKQLEKQFYKTKLGQKIQSTKQSIKSKVSSSIKSKIDSGKRSISRLILKGRPNIISIPKNKHELLLLKKRVQSELKKINSKHLNNTLKLQLSKATKKLSTNIRKAFTNTKIKLQLNDNILKMIKFHMTKLNLKIPSFKKLKSVVSNVATATAVIVESSQVALLKDEAHKKLKAEIASQTLALLTAQKQEELRKKIEAERLTRNIAISSSNANSAIMFVVLMFSLIISSLSIIS
jgi:hypothetical protein